MSNSAAPIITNTSNSNGGGATGWPRQGTSSRTGLGRRAASRFQFGRSIGSFQAIKHRLADAVLLVETSRVAADNAAAAVDFAGDLVSQRKRVIAGVTAKAYVCDAAVKICGDSLLSHGGDAG